VAKSVRGALVFFISYIPNYQFGVYMISILPSYIFPYIYGIWHTNLWKYLPHLLTKINNKILRILQNRDCLGAIVFYI